MAGSGRGRGRAAAAAAGAGGPADGAAPAAAQAAFGDEWAYDSADEVADLVEDPLVKKVGLRVAAPVYVLICFVSGIMCARVKMFDGCGSFCTCNAMGKRVSGMELSVTERFTVEKVRTVNSIKEGYDGNQEPRQLLSLSTCQC